MPDGRVISVGKERFGCPEYLFSPQFEDESFSIQNMITESILSCDDEVRGTLYNNIILSGGTSMLEGL
jgi:actin-related protein